MNVIVDEDTDIAVNFLDFCQAFFREDFSVLSRAAIEAKMSEYVKGKEKKAFQMAGAGYAAICYPCTDCNKESLN